MNLWERFYTEELGAAMRMSGCREKYIGGNASDFEKLEVLFKLLPLLKGHAAIDAVLELIDVDDKCVPRNSAREAWLRVGGDKAMKSTNDFNTRTQISDEKNNLVKKPTDIEQLLCGEGNFSSAVKKIFCEIEKNNIDIYIDLEGDEFGAPNRYLANSLYLSCQKIHNNIVKTQIICEILSNKMCQKTKIYINTSNDPKYMSELVVYLKRHNMNGRIVWCVDAEAKPVDILSVCSETDAEMLVTPHIVVMKNDDYDIVGKFKNELSRIYPIGMLTESGMLG